MDEQYVWKHNAFLYNNTYTTWSFQESGAVPTDRRTAERKNMNITGLNGTLKEYVLPKARLQTREATYGAAKEKLTKYNGNQEKAIHATVYDFYEKESANAKSIANSGDMSANKKQITSYQGKSLEEWSQTDELEKLKGLTGVSVADTEEAVDYAKFLEEKINEIFVKIQNGDTEPTYQIGAQSFTENEWGEFLDKFDSVEEAIQELMKEEQERKEAEEDVVINDLSTLLTTESTSCVYETADPDDDDIRYITWYTEEGIFCRKAGQTEGYEWSIAFENREQYDKVMEFIAQFPSDWNMRFAAHENFWNDFLNDEIDMDGFMEFINGTNKGVPDFSITVNDSMYIDKEKIQWAKYTNPLGARFYTAEEMRQMQMEIIAANEEKLKEQQVSYEEMYKRTHPDYNGEKIFRTISGGQLYTANEIDELLYKEMLERMGVTEEEEKQKRED